MSRCVWIRVTLLLQGLPPETSSEDLRKLLHPVTPLHIVRRAPGGAALPQEGVFVVFDGYEEASRALKQLDGKEVSGSALRLSYRFTSARDATWT